MASRFGFGAIFIKLAIIVSVFLALALGKASLQPVSTSFACCTVILVAVWAKFGECAESLSSPNDDPYARRTPTRMKIPYEDVNITTSDGVNLHGWLLKQKSAQVAPTVIFFHGNAGNISHRLENLAAMYCETGANILIVDYRGYGKSEGSPSEEGIYKDADAALTFAKQNQTVGKNIFLFGRSLGGAVAIDLAHRRGSEVKGLILENTFTSLEDVIYDLLPGLRHVRCVISALQRMHLESEKKMREINLPTLFISGRSDKLINPLQMDRLYEACGSPLKEKVDIEEGGHNDTWIEGDEAYFMKIKDFMGRVLHLSAEPDGSEKGKKLPTGEDQQANICVPRVSFSLFILGNDLEIYAMRKNQQLILESIVGAVLLYALFLALSSAITRAKLVHSKPQKKIKMYPPSDCPMELHGEWSTDNQEEQGNAEETNIHARGRGKSQEVVEVLADPAATSAT
ncbi:alpha/beta hydrolase domain-containing protein WAV2 [Cyclospora cayetanensis]|uniref:Alpha/beta hydrolase domain-containing protein WAV2 n=1 Tax=Cyclospora cayetanensis TaxID=88456 RepID=A0A6P6S026_9EIME|nr:alpha/beta hydrolase domain-containing protein WAV2 [Cyclospora cayetanensis]